MWFESKLSAAAGTLRAEAVELRNFLLSFRCTSEEFRVVIARLVYWMANYSPPWVAYRILMAYCLLTLDTIPGVFTVVIGETLCQALAKLIMSVAGDQAKTVCGNMQLYTGLKAGI